MFYPIDTNLNDLRNILHLMTKRHDNTIFGLENAQIHNIIPSI